MNPTLEMLQKHRDILDKYPVDEKCACDPADGRWCDFHAEFVTDLGQCSLKLLPALAERSLKLHEAIKDFLAYPVKGTQERLSRAAGDAGGQLRAYLNERQVDHEKEMELVRQRRREQ